MVVRFARGGSVINIALNIGLTWGSDYKAGLKFSITDSFQRPDKILIYFL